MPPDPDRQPHMRFVYLGVVFCRTDFLQIRSHPRHPCRQLMIPLIGLIGDFHSLEVGPAGRTQKNHSLLTVGP